MVQVALIIAFKVGNNSTQEGIADLSGKMLIKLLCNNAIIAKTTIDNIKIILKVVFSVMAFSIFS